MRNPKPKRLAIFWGCLIPLRLPWIEVAARKVLPLLGIELVDLPFSCCPDPVVSKSLDHQTWLALAARNLSIAGEKGLDILSLCAGCFETLKIAHHELEVPEKRLQIDSILSKVNRKYHGKIQVTHLQQWLYQDVGLEKLKSMVKHPLNFQSATHVGCHYTRPPEILQTDNPVYPEQLDELCEVLGINTSDYPDKNLCCGTGVGLVDRDISSSLVRRKLEGIRQTDAKALIAHCPSCIQSYDHGQKMLKTKQDPVPILHYLEVLGLALGLDPEEFAFDEHYIKIPAKLFR